MTMIPVATFDRTGPLEPVPLTADGSDVQIVDNYGNVFLRLENPTGGPLSCTVSTQAEPGGFALEDAMVSLAAGEVRWPGPWPPAIYNRDDNSVVVTPDAGLLVSALRY